MSAYSPPQNACTAADADLCAAAIAGDRLAFAQIVARYQDLVCSIAYSGLGDFGRSEDLAQETFVAAWQNLASLQHPAKLRSWLCGITRHKLNNLNRRLATDIAASAGDLQTHELASPPLEHPLDRAIRSEDQALLWSVLAELPENYREPLVLFYRSEQSVAEVAAQLDLTEEAVRQRLARGRRLLKAEVADLVEKTLRASRPGTAFAAAILAALPAAAPQAAAMGLAMTAKATGGKAAAAGLTAASGAIVGPLIGLVGAAFGVMAGLSSARSPRERRFGIHITLLVTALVVTLLAIQAMTIKFFPGAYRTIAFQAVLWGSYTFLLVTLIRWANWRSRQLREEDGTETKPGGSLGDLGEAPLRTVFWSLAGMMYGGVCWIAVAGHLAHEWLAPAVAFSLIAVTWWVLRRWLAAFDTLPRRVLALLYGVIAVAAINVVVGSLRWSSWQAAAPYHVANLVPLWAVNATILSSCAAISIPLLVWYRRANRAASRDPLPGGGQDSVLYRLPLSGKIDDVRAPTIRRSTTGTCV